ncbi:MAG TPA: hypothetical protein VF132_06100, partial [Rudaea sp.]
ATPGCGQDVSRNRYATLADCIADYSEAQCRDDGPVGSTYTGAHGYYGPWYRSDPSARLRDSNDPGPGNYLRSRGVAGLSSPSAGATSLQGPVGSESGTRGGFGSHGRVSARS